MEKKKMRKEEKEQKKKKKKKKNSNTDKKLRLTDNGTARTPQRWFTPAIPRRNVGEQLATANPTTDEEPRVKKGIKRPKTETVEEPVISGGLGKGDCP